MKILAVDPGETVGYALLSTGGGGAPKLIEAWQAPAITIRTAASEFALLVQRAVPDVVVVEDYRVFANKAAFHVGIELFTAKLIGAIEAVCTLNAPPVSMGLIQPSKKGRWPQARLEAKFPDWVKAPQPHGLDAVILGLVYLEAHYDQVP